MLNGMVQMLDLMGEDAEVTIEIKTESGEVISAPLKRVKAGSNIDGFVLTNIEE